MEPVYIVLPTSAFGGAEKRFLGLFVGLSHEMPNLRLVASDALLTLARSSEEFAVLRAPSLADRVVRFGEERGALSRALSRCHCACPDALFHYVLVPPPLVQRFLSRRVVFTVPLSGMNLYGRWGRATLYAGALASARTDFLDQGVHDHFVRRLRPLRRRFSVTPQSFIDTRYYEAVPATRKEDLVVFLGLLSDEKQAGRLVERLPAVLDRLDAAGHRVAVRLHGRETGQLPSIASRIASFSPPRNVESGFSADPRGALGRARVFLSLQRNTNYPSKSLLEALACGALPVITDVADSRRMVPEGVAEWVPRDFSADDLAQSIGRLLSLSPEEHDRRVALARAHLEEHFSFEGMAIYYRDLWRAAGGTA